MTTRQNITPSMPLGSEGVFLQLLEAAPDAIVIADRKGRILLANDEALSLFGYERHELLDELVEVLVPSRMRRDHVQKREDYAAAAVNRPMGSGLDIFGRHKDGREIPIDIKLSPLQTESELLVIAAIRDVTETKRKERLLEDTNALLKQKNKELALLNSMKNEFVGMAAHDLRNPLGVVRIVSELLLEGDAGDLNEEQKGMVSQTHRLSEFMLNLVNDMLDYSQIEAGKLALNLQSTSLVTLIQKNLTLHGRVAERKDIELIFEPVTDVPALSLDADKMEQVLNNLISNAISYSNSSTRIWITLAIEGDEAVVAVVDEGPGIPEAERERLFHPFEISSVKGSGGERSTGLGLTIAHKIVSGHNGRIWFDSEVGKGTTFYVALPLGAAAV